MTRDPIRFFDVRVVALQDVLSFRTVLSPYLPSNFVIFFVKNSILTNTGTPSSRHVTSHVCMYV